MRCCGVNLLEIVENEQQIFVPQVTLERRYKLLRGGLADPEDLSDSIDDKIGVINRLKIDKVNPIGKEIRVCLLYTSRCV